MKSSFRFIQHGLAAAILAGLAILGVLSPLSIQAQDNTAYGTGALHTGSATGTYDSAFGFDTLYHNTTGGYNTAAGLNALLGNTTGSYNTAFGQAALKANTTGSSNTATGFESLLNCTTDSQNTALGYQSLFSDSIGYGGIPNQNVALGYQALYSSTDGFENLAAGYQALYHSIHGDENTALGYQALFGITTGAGNIAIGHLAGSLLTTGSDNIDIGNVGVAGDNKIIRIGDGTQTATYLTGVIHGNGSGLTGVSVPASAVTGSIPGSRIAAGSVTGTQLGSGLTLTGVTTGSFSGNGSGLANIPSTAVSGTIPATQVGTPPPGMVLIPGGSFKMGNVVGSGSDSDIADAAPVTVTVSAFYMDANLVSLGQGQSVYFWATSNGYTFDDAGGGDTAHNPVYNVNWYDCVKWCNARSQQAGLTAVYYTDAGFTTVYKTGDPGTVYMNMAAGGYRLPTEAEWEKAARGGLSGQRFPWGDTIDETLANYYGDTTDYSYDLGPNGYNALDTLGATNGSTTPIGTFPANGYGLYDMAGNVFEWCWDWYGTPYGQPTTTNPTGPTSGSGRVLRGSAFSGDAGGARCADRYNDGPDGVINGFGFRSVLSPGQP